MKNLRDSEKQCMLVSFFAGLHDAAVHACLILFVSVYVSMIVSLHVCFHVCRDARVHACLLVCMESQ